MDTESETGMTELSIIKDSKVRIERKMDKFIGAATGNQCLLGKNYPDVEIL